MLSRLASGIGLLWFLLLCVTAWTWGGNAANEDLSDALWYSALAASGLVSVAWAAVLVREKHGRWLLAVVPLGALVATIVLLVAAYNSDEGGEWPPGFAFLMFVVVLGVPSVVGVAIGQLWRFSARRRQGDPALPEAG